MKIKSIIILCVTLLFMGSCSSSKHTYKGCDGKKKFKSQMSFR